MPDTFAESSEGVVLIVNGAERPLRWDGNEITAVPAGVIPPSAAPAVTFSGTGAITGTYVAYVRFVDRYGNLSDLSPASTQAAATANGTVTYSNVPVPVEPKVTRRQVLRNTAGQLGTYYVDIDTTDVSSPTLVSARADADLAAQTAQPLFDVDGAPLANVHGLPPDHKPYVAFHLTRMWMAGDFTYAEGSARVTNGSTTVTGDGTEWTAELANRFLHVTGATRAYQIASVNEAAQTLVLDDAYADPTNEFAAYAIRPAPAESSLLYFSGAGEPESWPATNALTLPEDSDVITGLMPKGSFLYVLKRRRIYRVTAHSNPIKDGFVFLTAQRGCVNNRCWVIADEVAYLLDEGGVHAFDGTDAARNVSTPIQSYFQAGRSPINWSAGRYFHASHYPGQETVRWFVCLHGEYLPRHALCYAYRARKWWAEEFAVPIGASALGRVGRASGTWNDSAEQVYLGGHAGRVYAFGDGALDGPEENSGTLRGTATAAGRCSLTDTSASFPSLANAPVAIAAGRGRGQVRVVVSNTATRLNLDRPWAVKPDATSVYRVGGVRYRWVSSRMRYAPSEDREGASAELMFEPAPESFRLSAAHDYGGRLRQGTDRTAVRVSARKDEAGRDVDMNDPTGFALCQFPRNRERSTAGPRFVQLTIDGIGPVAFGELVVNGVV